MGSPTVAIAVSASHDAFTSSISSHASPIIARSGRTAARCSATVPVECTFDEGDNVVYPHHGAGVVLKKESRDMMGEQRDYLTIKILHNDMTVMVPCENAEAAGLDTDDIVNTLVERQRAATR